jgi:hypothetical protein
LGLKSGQCPGRCGWEGGCVWPCVDLFRSDSFARRRQLTPALASNVVAVNQDWWRTSLQPMMPEAGKRLHSSFYRLRGGAWSSDQHAYVLPGVALCSR